MVHGRIKNDLACGELGEQLLETATLCRGCQYRADDQIDMKAAYFLASAQCLNRESSRLHARLDHKA